MRESNRKKANDFRLYQSGTWDALCLGVDNTNTADRHLAKHRTEACYEAIDKRHTSSSARPAKKAYNRASRRHGKALARAAY